MSGIVKSIGLTTDEHGREVLRVIIDYQKGEAPDLKWKVVFERTPVDVVLAAILPPGGDVPR